MREKELQLLIDFIKSKQSFMYLSGIPGCGKTWTVKKLKEKYINCICDDIELSGNVTILDEIDQINASTWDRIVKHVSSGYKVIGIANTLDTSVIPEELIDSLQVISFTPYTCMELCSIATSICNDLDKLIDPPILEFLSRKCASNDSDIRRLTSWIKGLPDNSTLKDAIEISKDSKLCLYSGMPLHAKHLLCLLYFYFQQHKQKTRTLQLYSKLKIMYKNKHSVPCPQYSEFLDLINVLESKSFVIVKKNCISLEDKVDSQLFILDNHAKSLYYSFMTEE